MKSYAKAILSTFGLLALIALGLLVAYYGYHYFRIVGSFSESSSFAERYECTEREGPFLDSAIIFVDRSRSDACYGDSVYAIPSVDAQFRRRMKEACFIGGRLLTYFGRLTPSGVRPFIDANRYNGFVGQYECLWLSLHFPSANYEITCSKPLKTCEECYCSLKFSPDDIHVIHARIPNMLSTEHLLRLAALWADKLKSAD